MSCVDVELVYSRGEKPVLISNEDYLSTIYTKIRFLSSFSPKLIYS
jgi:hypothetical protein